MASDKGIVITLKNGVYHLVGRLDEFSSLDMLVNATEPIVMDLAKVDWINSVGIRNFSFLVKGWGKKKYIYRNCPVVFVDALNSVRSLMGAGGSIESLYIPVFCGRCDYEEEHLVTAEEIKDKSIFRAPRGRCAKCGELLEIDQAYFTCLLGEKQ